MKKQFIILSEEQKAEYEENEQINARTETLLFIAEISGNAELIEEAKDIVKNHNKRGYLDEKLSEKCDNFRKKIIVSDKYLNLIRL